MAHQCHTPALSKAYDEPGHVPSLDLQSMQEYPLHIPSSFFLSKIQKSKNYTGHLQILIPLFLTITSFYGTCHTLFQEG